LQKFFNLFLISRKPLETKGWGDDMASVKQFIFRNQLENNKLYELIKDELDKDRHMIAVSLDDDTGEIRVITNIDFDEVYNKLYALGLIERAKEVITGM